LKRAVVLVVALLISALVSIILIDVSRAYHTDLPAVVEINSPVQTRVYPSNSVPISVMVESPRKDYWRMTAVRITVYLDDNVASVRLIRPDQQGRVAFYSSFLDLENEKTGLHSLYIVADIAYISEHPQWPVSDFTGSGKSAVVNFRTERADVHPPDPAAISFLAPKKGSSFEGANVPLRVLISNLSDVYSISYYLDGIQVYVGWQIALDEKEVFSNGQQILLNMHVTAELSEGNHTVKVSVSNQNMEQYVWYDMWDSYAPKQDVAYSDAVNSSSKVSFTVDKESPSETENASMPFLTSATAVASVIIASVAVVSFGLLAYFLRRKGKRGNQT
jgi:hypothetical protein